MGEKQMHPSVMVVCHDCDLVQSCGLLAFGQQALCVRCGAVVRRGPGVGLEACCALVLAGLMVFCLANVFPLLIMSVQGVSAAATVWGAVLALWRQGMWPVALLVAATTILAPLMVFLLLGYLMFPLLWRRPPPGFKYLLCLLHYLRPWVMAEVFLMGVLVALVKLAHMADLAVSTGLWAFVVLIVLLALNASQFDSQRLWACYRQRNVN